MSTKLVEQVLTPILGMAAAQGFAVKDWLSWRVARMFAWDGGANN
jgi:hypothetical protein